ncbi:serine hydrolase domain-containing protein [Streptomyces sp. TRM75563]|uniref:serine hydrolase domain-containing protein n=1 Tax=Streptomyces sp. TRM75563 TaxID=2817418 RepID=UPI001F621828|nr:serine hydrolase domain-containing protein [Streptomyces sp. TRM75563]MCI4040603.1 beta-lactamase family protein [Streptomyces sp. TRM75563]
MNRSVRTLLATALVLGIAGGTAGPVSANSPVDRAPGSRPEASGAPRSQDAPDARALRAAIAGLPHQDAVAALVRVSGSAGSWRGSAGLHDLPSGRPADPAARFRAGSVTKVFTAAAVLQLAGERKLSLDRTVRHYLPDLIPASYGEVTVHQLLNHTSGIPAADLPGTNPEEWYAHRFDVHTPSAMVASATAKEREFAPGGSQHYLNINYTVLGLLIERVTGHAYEREVADRILRPLGLRSTYFPGADPRILGPHNRGYQVFAAPGGGVELRDVTVWGPTDGWAAGDIISTTADLERFTTALFGGRVVRGPLLEEMFTLPDASVRTYGSGEPARFSTGLSVLTLGGRQVWGKSGGRWGYSTAVAATRDLSRTLVYSVGATDAKGKDANATAMGIAVAAFGPPPAT